jgi:hypothetical protein
MGISIRKAWTCNDKGYFILRICAFVSHTPEIILNTDYFMLLFIKNVYYKILFPEYCSHRSIWEFNIISPND